MDWWEERPLGRLAITCTPARHFSGRRLTDKDRTLWASFAVSGAHERFYYSGDSAYSHHFAEIGSRLGPFDLTIIKIGAYDPSWPDVHVNPEQAVQAHRELGGRVLLPVHWATFNLAFHAWDDPIKRLVAAASRDETLLLTPRVGETVALSHPPEFSAWWETVK